MILYLEDGRSLTDRRRLWLRISDTLSCTEFLKVGFGYVGLVENGGEGEGREEDVSEVFCSLWVGKR